MEHLPPVSNPYEPIYIPFVGVFEYDNLEFLSYPERKGWNIDRVLEGGFQDRLASEVAGFLQRWLYFGMLHEILNFYVNSVDFVRVDESGKKWLTTKNLPVFLQNFRTQVEEDRNKEDKAEIFKRRNNRIRNCLALSRSVWLKISELENDPLSGEVSLGIHILAYTLQCSATEICGLGRGLRYPTETSNQSGYRDVPWRVDRTWQITRNPFITQRMIEQGWCPSVVDQIRNDFKVLGQYYDSLMGPPKRKLDHST